MPTLPTYGKTQFIRNTVKNLFTNPTKVILILRSFLIMQSENILFIEMREKICFCHIGEEVLSE